MTGKTSEAAPDDADLSERWQQQRSLDAAVAAIASGRDPEAIALAKRFRSRPAVFVGLLARMTQSHRTALTAFAIDSVQQDGLLLSQRSGGRALIHYAAGAGSLEVIQALLRQGADPNSEDAMGHPPLYRVANQCSSQAGPEIAKTLIKAGAAVNAASGVTGATALHMAARRGRVDIARALLECGASTVIRDRKGDTPLRRARNCRKDAVVHLLESWKPLAE